MNPLIAIGRIFAAALLFSLLPACGETGPRLPWGEDGRISVVLTTSRGEIEIRLATGEAPRHAENFARLCENGFYNGTYFHRVAPEVLIQGGDPNTRDEDPSNDGKGGYSFRGPGTTLQAEISKLKHLRGSVSMARGSDPDSAGSQFFILLKDDPKLDGLYSVFGEVTRGIEVVESIAEEPGRAYPEEVGGVNPERHQMIEDCRIILPDATEVSEDGNPD